MNHLIQARALFGRGDGRPPHGTGGKGRDGCGGPAAIARYLPLGERIVLGQLHPNELGRQVQH